MRIGIYSPTEKRAIYTLCLSFSSKCYFIYHACFVRAKSLDTLLGPFTITGGLKLTNYLSSGPKTLGSFMAGLACSNSF